MTTGYEHSGRWLEHRPAYLPGVLTLARPQRCTLNTSSGREQSRRKDIRHITYSKKSYLMNFPNDIIKITL